MEVFFIRYRKILLFGSAFMLLYFFYEMYKGIASISSSNTAGGIGTLVDAGISLFLSIYFFVNVRKAKSAVNKENAASDTK
ncbi:hypothetical protein KXD93_27120 [Mucilaginibacter sp. BJC16-A38]|uniref:hypothetical protein n=1 Tax=Mucilaginibacter phenanthrenivorans TaxID=1234842 RepID=UPI0021577436|nr:hypothetical protein [Mucilaginibacter phenanthrenivorans]MCR8561354.1 hypothetical protein [Mucilaginibacter phenanthrenivorans]